MRPQCDKTDKAPCITFGSLDLFPSFSFFPSLLCKRWVCVFSFFPLILQRISFVLNSGARLLSCSVCLLSSPCAKLTRSSPPHLPQKRENKIPPRPNVLQRNRTFLESSKEKMQQYPHFLPTYLLAICSRPFPPWLFFKVPSHPRQQLSSWKPPQSLHLASIKLLLVRFLLILQTLIKVSLSNKCNPLERGVLIFKNPLLL